MKKRGTALRHAMVYHASKETMTKPSLKGMYSPALLSTGLPLEIADPDGEREFKSQIHMANPKKQTR